ncbi:hypothetical protein Taro_008896 [Colocasia esculenta]|uniref:Ubiquitin-like protease family profile domain-containing protein n=1 Tax=Colocasia esculenta TaxID=4460 RepID=A0A843U2G4_COLES|nr:hypothetical protein [Colocasia esculenta]
MRSKMIPRRQTPKASGEPAPPALPAKRTEEEDSAPSSSSSSDDGAKCQEFKNALKGICSLENYVKERDQMGFRDCHRAMLRTTLFAPFVDSNHRAIFKMTFIEEIAHTYKGAKIGRYNWAAAVTEMTFHKFDDFVTVVREKRFGLNTTPKRRIAGREHDSANIFGCSVALAIIKHLKLATKEKTTITCVSQEKMHVQTEGVAAPPHPALMALIQGLGDEIRLLPERLEQSKSSNEAQFEALTTAVTMGFNKIEKLISSTSMAQDQPTVGTDAENFFSTPPSLTPAPAAPAYGDANASVLIVDQGIIAQDPVSVVPTTVLLSPTSLVKNIKCRDDRQPGIYDQSPLRRLDKALKKHTSYQRKKGKKAMSKLLRFYKQWTWKSEASERQRALVEAFLAEEGYVDHNHTALTFTNNCSLKWSHIWDIVWGNMTDDEVIDIVLHAMKERQREQEALIPNSYHRWEFLGTILGSWINHTDGSNDDRGHKLHTSLGHENLGCPISDFQFLFFVVHVSNHWVLLSLELEQHRIVVYNSCRGHATYDTCARNWNEFQGPGKMHDCWEAER